MPASQVTTRGSGPTRSTLQSRPAAAAAMPTTARASTRVEGRSGVCRSSATRPATTSAARCTSPIRPRDQSHTARPIPKHCQRNITRPWKTVENPSSAAPSSMITSGTAMTPHAIAGSVHRRRQNPRPTAAAAAAARVNMASCAGSVQYEWSR
ncbi:hypothetical protein GCM10023200_42430 [Actinomycetospora chlora]|uniref:Uncharacterized protein n=1 Tax=Actinomycetospora chlora TaxID=663608 RepID=A0ABP9BWF3_9PSEU